MTTYAYTARDKSGHAVTGTVTAASEAEAVGVIRAEGKYPVQVRPAPAGGFASAAPAAAHPASPAAAPGTPGGPATAAAGVRRGRGVRLSRAEVIQLSTQLAIMVETGVILSDALDCIGRQADKPHVRELVRDVAEQIQGGTSLSEALARHPRSFPRIYLALIRASEKSGMLPRLLNRATGYLRDEQETLRRVKGALTYPAIMFSFALGTTVFLLTFVLPRFTVIYATKKAALPVPTQALMAASDFLIGNWVALLIGGVVSAVGWALSQRTEAGRRYWHSVQLGLPLFGALYRKLHLSRGLRMVGTLSAAGVPLMDCVETAEGLCENSHFRGLWRQVAGQIQAGRQLSEPLFRSPLVPRSVAQMISAGEKSGKLAVVMEQISAYAEAELKEQIAALTRYIEPAMIIGMGLIIGAVTLALLLPVFTISKVMAH